MPIPALLVTLAEAKDQIRTTHTFSDAELQRTLDDAEDMIRLYLKARNDPSWTPATVPGAVRAAILRQFTHLFAARGDRAESNTGEAGLAPHVEHSLNLYRDPAFA